MLSRRTHEMWRLFGLRQYGPFKNLSRNFFQGTTLLPFSALQRCTEKQIQKEFCCIDPKDTCYKSCYGSKFHSLLNSTILKP
ncbi:hypothetical protein L596_000410 [Steinernema carpocapsae]|uniref:Uncharacterized protein n=1 Tax=Steinernema carpocapsae TaxID=34508 RepID=A0A4U8UIX4_STECR|nr:hypothetical protein L596_000410 [Steinernema carpocapsae]